MSSMLSFVPMVCGSVDLILPGFSPLDTPGFGFDGTGIPKQGYFNNRHIPKYLT